MIVLTYEQSAKIQLLDTLFDTLSIDELKEYTESEKIVSILKGKTEKSSLLSRFVQEHDILSIEMGSQKAEVAMMKHDLQVLIKLVLKPNDYNSHSDATALKSKYHIY